MKRPFYIGMTDAYGGSSDYDFVWSSFSSAIYSTINTYLRFDGDRITIIDNTSVVLAQGKLVYNGIDPMKRFKSSGLATPTQAPTKSPAHGPLESACEVAASLSRSDQAKLYRFLYNVGHRIY